MIGRMKKRFASPVGYAKSRSGFSHNKFSYENLSMYKIKRFARVLSFTNHIPLGTARLPTPKCIGNDRISRSKCIMENMTRQRESSVREYTVQFLEYTWKTTSLHTKPFLNLKKTWWYIVRRIVDRFRGNFSSSFGLARTTSTQYCKHSVFLIDGSNLQGSFNILILKNAWSNPNENFYSGFIFAVRNDKINPALLRLLLSCYILVHNTFRPRYSFVRKAFWGWETGCPNGMFKNHAQNSNGQYLTIGRRCSRRLRPLLF